MFTIVTRAYQKIYYVASLRRRRLLFTEYLQDLHLVKYVCLHSITAAHIYLAVSLFSATLQNYFDMGFPKGKTVASFCEMQIGVLYPGVNKPRISINFHEFVKT